MLHPTYIETLRRLAICRRCDDFRLRPRRGNNPDTAECSHDSDPWAGPMLLCDWGTGHVPRTCSMMAEHDPLEALRQL